MLEARLLLLITLVAAGLAAWAALRWRTRRYLGRAADLLEPSAGRGLVLAFPTPDCVPCRTQQKPALAELQRCHPDIAVREIDAAAFPALARRFGILTVPSTVAVAAAGVVRAINHGLATCETLALQLHLDGHPAAAGVRVPQPQEVITGRDFHG